MKESAVSFELLALCYRPPVSRPSFLFSRAATTYASPARKCGVSMPQERSPPKGRHSASCPLVHNPLLPRFGRKSKMLRMHRLHLHRNPDHTTPGRTEHIPQSFILNIIQEISLIINFKLQMKSP